MRIYFMRHCMAGIVVAVCFPFHRLRHHRVKVNEMIQVLSIVSDSVRNEWKYYLDIQLGKNERIEQRTKN